MDLVELKTQVSNIKTNLDSLNGKINYINETILKNESDLKHLENQKLNQSKAVEVLQIIQQSTREKTTQEFENVVSYALQYIMNYNYKAKLEFSRRGNLPELNFKLCKDDEDYVTDPKDSNGGGVVDIYSLALRLTLLQLTKNNGFLVMDESFKHLDPSYIEEAYSFLKIIADKFNKQIIWITHHETIQNNSDYKIKIGG